MEVDSQQKLIVASCHSVVPCEWSEISPMHGSARGTAESQCSTITLPSLVGSPRQSSTAGGPARLTTSQPCRSRPGGSGLGFDRSLFLVALGLCRLVEVSKTALSHSRPCSYCKHLLGAAPFIMHHMHSWVSQAAPCTPCCASDNRPARLPNNKKPAEAPFITCQSPYQQQQQQQ